MNINKIGIYYFSGTGNTKLMAELFCKQFKINKINTDLIPIEDIIRKKRPVNIDKYDLIGFGYPVHAFSAPQIFFDFIYYLPKETKKKTFTFKTSGDPLFHGGATSLIRKKLKKKGYLVFHENLIVMPANIAIKYNDRLIKQLYNVAQRKIKKKVGEIINEKENLQKNNIILRVFTYLFNSMESLGAKYFGKYLKTSEFCTLCGLCIEECPTNNISKVKGKIFFGKNCAFCMRCVYRCPKNAISNRFLNFFIIKEGYNIQNIIDNPSIKGDFITNKTRGYFKHFYTYFISD